MIPKQQEMDDIARTIYTAIENEYHLANTLFVLCGDHGMNEGGNHGGSSPGETSPALVFMSPKLTKITQGKPKTQSPTQPKTEGEFDYYRTVEQSDIAPTLAGLLGFPVPRNNLGVFLNEFLEFWDSGESSILVLFKLQLTILDSDREQLLYRNALQMKHIVEATYTGQNFDSPALERTSHSESGELLQGRWRRAMEAMTQGNVNDKPSHPWSRQSSLNKVSIRFCNDILQGFES